MRSLNVNELEMIQGGISANALCGIGIGLVIAAIATGGTTGYAGGVMIGLFCLVSDSQ